MTTEATATNDQDRRRLLPVEDHRAGCHVARPIARSLSAPGTRTPLSRSALPLHRHHLPGSQLCGQPRLSVLAMGKHRPSRTAHVRPVVVGDPSAPLCLDPPEPGPAPVLPRAHVLRPLSASPVAVLSLGSVAERGAYWRCASRRIADTCRLSVAAGRSPPPPSPLGRPAGKGQDIQDPPTIKSTREGPTARRHRGFRIRAGVGCNHLIERLHTCVCM